MYQEKTKGSGLNLKFLAPFLPALLATGIALGSFLIARSLLSDIQTLWWRDLLSIIVAGITLSGYSAALGRRVVSSEAVAAIMFVAFILTLVHDYTGDKRAVTSKEVATVTTNNKVITLALGTNTFVLKKFEETPWMQLPRGMKLDCYFGSSSSPRNNFVIMYNDGTIYSGSTAYIPGKKFPVFKIKSGETQKVFIIVEKSKQQ